jgi:integrase
MQGKITKRAVDALKADASGETTLWDADVKGFGVRARSGGTKTYIVRYRPGAGGRDAPLRTYTIGPHGSPWTPDLARAEAKRLLGLVEGGADPAADHVARRDAPTMSELAARFLAEHAEAKRKDRTATEYRRLIEKLILPAIGKRKVADVTRHEIAKLHHGQRATPYQANRVLAVLRKMFNLAEQWGMRPDGSNPCRHVEKFKERERERFLSSLELAALGEALSTYEGSPHIAAAVRLLVFTGARLGEILGLRWEWIDFGRGEVRLPDSKTGAKTLHLPPPALAVLADLPRLEGNPYTIVGQRAGQHLVNLEKPWRAIRERATVRLWCYGEDSATAKLVESLAHELGREPTVRECRKAARAAKVKLSVGLTDVRLHDLRHAFASVAAASGMGLPIIGKMLGHSQPATTARYAHLAPDPVKAAAAAVADKIAGAMKGAAGGAEVTRLRG